MWEIGRKRGGGDWEEEGRGRLGGRGEVGRKRGGGGWEEEGRGVGRKRGWEEGGWEGWEREEEGGGRMGKGGKRCSILREGPYIP
jgi:hypothetical protein